MASRLQHPQRGGLGRWELYRDLKCADFFGTLKLTFKAPRLNAGVYKSHCPCFFDSLWNPPTLPLSPVRSVQQ